MISQVMLDSLFIDVVELDEREIMVKVWLMDCYQHSGMFRSSIRCHPVSVHPCRIMVVLIIQ